MKITASVLTRNMSDRRARASTIPRGSDMAMPDTPMVIDSRKPPKRSESTAGIDGETMLSASRAASPARTIHQTSGTTRAATTATMPETGTSRRQAIQPSTGPARTMIGPQAEPPHRNQTPISG